jgi:hypothetical protein
MFSIILRSRDFYIEFYAHFLCGFLIMLDYDEMNCNIVSRIFYNVFEVQIIVICNNHEFDVGMNGVVKFVET